MAQGLYRLIYQTESKLAIAKRAVLYLLQVFPFQAIQTSGPARGFEDP